VTNNDSWQERGDRHDHDSGGMVLGLLLVLAGGAFLVSNLTGFDLSKYGWPIYVIAPGAALLVFGLLIRSENGLGAAIPGGLLLSTGLLLAFQDATDTYDSWSYAWALVAPGSVGATLLLFGITHGRMDLIDAGLRTAAVGLGLFIGFGLFFENVVGLGETSHTSALRDAMPFLAVAMGVVIVLLNLIPRRARDDSDTEPSGSR